MKEKYYTINTDLKKELLKKYNKNQRGYKKWDNIFKILKILSLAIVLGFVAMAYLSLKDLDTLLVGILSALGLGLALASVPFAIGHVIKPQVGFRYGYPYSVMVREYLLISEDGVKFVYHNLENENSDSIDSYEIPKENMNAVIYNQEYQIVTIIGEAKLIAYENVERTIINEKNSQRKFYENSPYEIMLAFDEEEEIVKLLKGMAKNARDK